MIFTQIGNRYSSENAMEQPEDQKFSIASGSQLSSSQNLLNQKNHLDSTSPSNITSESYPERNCQIIPSGASFAERNLKGIICAKLSYGMLSSMFSFLVV